jgi:hypothetical protein
MFFSYFFGDTMESHFILRIPLYLRNEMSTKGPNGPSKMPKYSTLTPKKVSDSSVSPKKVMLVLYLNTAISWTLL